MIKQIYKKLISEKKRNELRTFVKKALAPAYSGTKFTCNCCNKSFRKFRPKGKVNLRKNAECPNCGSLERTRVLDFYLHNETGLYTKKGLKVLHFAPELCLYNALNQLDVEYIDGDINPDLARHVVDVTNIPYPDNYFDYIICSHVLGHVPDEAKALSELKRVINTKGTILIMSLIDHQKEQTYEDACLTTPEEKLKHYTEPDLCRLYGRDFRNRLENAGFSVSEIDYRKQFSKEDQYKFQLGDGNRELIFQCKKHN